MGARSLPALLEVVGANPPLPFTGAGIVDAYKEGLITSGEAQKLERFSRLSPKAQKRELKRPREVSDAQIQKTRADLDRVMGEFWARFPDRSAQSDDPTS